MRVRVCVCVQMRKRSGVKPKCKLRSAVWPRQKCAGKQEQMRLAMAHSVLTSNSSTRRDEQHETTIMNKWKYNALFLF